MQSVHDLPHFGELTSHYYSQKSPINGLSKSSSGTTSSNDGMETNVTSIEDNKRETMCIRTTGSNIQNEKDVTTGKKLMPRMEVISPLISSENDLNLSHSNVLSTVKAIAEDENNFKVSIPVDSTFVSIQDDNSSNTSSSNLTEIANQDFHKPTKQFKSMHSYRILSEPKPKAEDKNDFSSILDPLIPETKSAPDAGLTSIDISENAGNIPKSQTFPRLSSDETSKKNRMRTNKQSVISHTNASTIRSSTDRRTFHSINTIKIPDDYLKTELAVYPDFDVNRRLTHSTHHRHHLSVKSADMELIRRIRLPRTTSFLNNSRMKAIMKADDLYNIPGQNISESHQNYTIVYELVTGIRSSVSRCTKAHEEITPEDFNKVFKLIFNRQGTTEAPPTKYEFKFKDYAPEVFRDLRRMFNVNQADYLISLNDEIGVRAVGSSGKSGSSFYYSNDRKFIIKTIHRSEHKHLRRILKDYYNYVRENPNTLLCQFYGLHRLKMMTRTGIVKVHVLVMNNMLPPTVRMSDSYDLKGSTHGRKTTEQKIAQGSCMKDLNFIEKEMKIQLSTLKKEQVITQLTKDVALLEKLNIMDYSLLLGISYLNLSEEEVAERCQRISMIVHQNVPGAHKNTLLDADGGIRAVDSNGEELEMIYYIGIIDCLTNYNTLKKLETFFRTLRYKRESISAIPPYEYGSRFLKFITQNIISEGDVTPSKKRSLNIVRAFRNITNKQHTA